MSDEVSHEMQLEWAELEKEIDWTWMKDVDWEAYEAESRTRQNNHPPQFTGLGECDGMTALLQQHVASSQLRCPSDAFEDSGTHIETNRVETEHDALESRFLNGSDAGPQLNCVDDDNVAAPSTTHRCTIDGCNYKGSFARAAELKRHINTKHNGEKSFACTVSGCFKRQRAPAFVRGDKLTSHLRTVHSPTEPATCPMPTCNVQLPLVLLGIHIDETHHGQALWCHLEQDPSLPAKLKAYVHASDTMYTRCPYSRCRQNLKVDRFIDHVLSHKFEEQEEMKNILKELNYALIRVPKAGSIMEAAGHQSRSAKSLDYHSELRISCPVCEHTCDDRFTFAVHLARDHMIQDSAEARAEFDAATRDRELAHIHHEFNRWSDPASSFRHWLLRCAGRPKCHSCNHCYFPSCQCETKPPLRSDDDIIESLRPHRTQILHLLPPFKQLAPIFKDII
ncbi:hypothetical protein M409DRAFT_56146 [Zasmidium cellare ATCC 36951]|uniref:C2H2-type domain-containing protein n=1 Tax=Zasmidium cellare ATCC 36951 TaxID=1080233 RepID=A0A6A6CH63_ZASCE|nr:uncharacterized protein M409DRAFT_56146 [Zasmidium cellare ATCC 36951]KAF2165282.1 hypothetical protein M409DRAFT_56146 [Zasmidium cellare ATCC 36951]